MAIWLLGPDPNNQCCGCEGKTSPCDSCSVDCCYVYPSDHFSFIENAAEYLSTDVGGCYAYATYTAGSVVTRDSIAGTLTDGVLAGSASLSSSVEALGLSDSMGMAFSLTNGQTANVSYNLSMTPDIPGPFYGYDVFLFSGGGLAANAVVYSANGLGSVNSSFNYTASGNGCFYLFANIGNSQIDPPQLATVSTSVTISPNIVPSPVMVGYGFPAAYTGKYGCDECDPTAAELP